MHLPIPGWKKILTSWRSSHLRERRRQRRLALEALEQRQLLSVTATVDDGDAAFAAVPTVGGWSSGALPGGYGGDYLVRTPGTGNVTATWTFTGLTAGKKYEVLATWVADSNRASNAPFTIIDGSNPRWLVQMNETVAPAAFTVDSHSWERLGEFTVSGDQLSVQLSDAANGYVVADAIHISEVPSRILDNSNVGNGYSESGTSWTTSTLSPAYLGTYRYHAYNGGNDKATWTFNNVTPGRPYQVLATWSPYSNRPMAAPYTILDGSTTLGTTYVNQQLAPAGVTLDGWTWQDVGVYNSSSSNLTVRVSDASPGYVIADAIRLVDISVDNPPVVADRSFTIDEPPATGATVGNVGASDPDYGQTLTYATGGGSGAGLFAIDSAGNITVTSGPSLDFVAHPYYDLTVQVTDNGAPATTTIATTRIYGSTMAYGMLGNWRFDDAAGTTAVDAAGASNGTLTGGPTWTTGYLGGAMNFDGTNDYVALGNSAALNVGGVITLSAWIKPESTAGIQTIIAHGATAASPAGVYLRINNGNYEVGSASGSNQYKATCTMPAGDVGQWVHLMGVYDGTQWNLYRNGVLSGTYATSNGAIQTTANWAIGAAGNGTERFFQGVIDDVRVYNVALDSGTIAQVTTPAAVVAPPLVFANDTAALTLDSGGAPITQWTVDWGDGTPTDTYPVASGTASHTYFAAGTYNVTATPTGGLQPYSLSAAFNVSSIGQDFLTNGSFESPDVAQGHWDLYYWIDGWQRSTASGNNLIEVQDRDVRSSAAQGSQYVELDGDKFSHDGDGSMGIYQTVTTVPGQWYDLSFAYTGRPGTTMPDNSLVVTITDFATNSTLYTNAATPLPGNPSTDAKWDREHQIFMAIGWKTTVAFADGNQGTWLDNTLGTLLDDVRLVSTTSGGGNLQDCGCNTCSACSPDNLPGDDKKGDSQLHQTIGEIDLDHATTCNPYPVVAVDYTMPAGSPDYLVAQLTLGSVVGPSVYYSTSGFAAGDAVHIAQQVNATTLATGRYPYSLKITAHYATGSGTTEYDGYREVVNRSTSEIANHWSFGNLDRLLESTDPNQPGVLLVRGDDTAGWFADDGRGGYLSPHGTYGQLAKNSSGFTITYPTGLAEEYDAQGYLQDRIDSDERITAYGYGNVDADADPELTSVTDPLGHVTTLTYSGGLLASITDFDGRVTTIARDGSNRIASITRPDPDGGGPLNPPVTSYTYDALDRVASVTNPESGTVEYEYYAGGSVKKATYPNGSYRTLTPVDMQGVVDLSVTGYDASHLATLIAPSAAVAVRTDQLSQSSTYTADVFSNDTSALDEAGVSHTYTRNSDGRLVRDVEPSPTGSGTATTSYTYDTKGNLVQTVYADGSRESWTYDPKFSRATSHTDALGRVTLYEIDPATGDLVSVTQVVGQPDSAANAETDDVTTSYTYTDGSGAYAALPKGLVLTETDPLGHVTQYVYYTNPALGSFAQVQSVTTAYGTVDAATTSYLYDAAGNCTQMTDPLLRVTTYGYDALDRQTSVTQPDPDGPSGPQTAPTTQYVYDGNNNVAKVIDPLGNVTETQYCPLGVRTLTTWQPDPLVVGARGPETDYGYDAALRMTSVTDALGRTTNYAYDSLGRQTQEIGPYPEPLGTVIDDGDSGYVSGRSKAARWAE